ncbi:cilia- and flagella-associated protein 65-like [Physella acuta]|uniref:cilia- and flagella-associated protein 65-like n=1 Tax=Physella acuta TaxID=109671 RepID=UPI0027DC9FCA|nr:cilia- and flagella-associated protein 65-like [Physella acuta]XP_059144554.1 cilia- and flagella-associated protein 65-like [Physella acuta]XP_059144555.1 cilia- and flagella-associated protein 65-like [Physella acuta]XP_059144556.1 cilia- and flagella-associated protein 65-like [Physella acuta]
MPTGELAPQQALQLSKDTGKINSPASMSPVNSILPEQTIFFGIEAVDKLVWKGWGKGIEYSKNLVLKNLTVKIIKLTYSVPQSRFFSTLYPKPIFLSAGATFTLPVSFRPLENVPYDDAIFFKLQDGNRFSVELMAILPVIDICIPIDLDFKMCAVKDSVSITFEVFNTGDLDTCVMWEVKEPFLIEPTEALLSQQASVKFRATFRPQGAFVYEVTAVCKFGPNYEFSRPTKFYGIGKFPHLLVSLPGKNAQSANSDKLNEVETEVNFQQVAVATSAGKWVELHNLSPVRTLFCVERVPGISRMETAFHCSTTQGVVPPMSVMKIPLTFSPHVPNITSIDYFSVLSVGNISHSTIKCVGSSVGPKVELSLHRINFQVVNEGHSGTRSFEIINKSNMEAVYRFEIDCEESVFKFPQTSGILKPNSSETVVLSFLPEHPINYYRRVPFLVHNQPPIFLDLLGTCHSELVKPAVLKGRHISRYFTHVERGISVLAPDYLDELVKSGRIVIDNNGCLEMTNDEDKAELVTNISLKDVSSMDEYFNDGIHSQFITTVPHVSLDTPSLDFGNCPNLKATLEKTVTITNHTRGKVTVQWNGDTSHTFYVTPATIDVPPLKTCSFRVSFKPKAENQIYGNELECFVSYKSLRDYRLVEDKTMCPPWCLTLSCIGHTFLPNNETFLPRTSIFPSVLVFPAVNTGESSYRSIVVQNTGDTPILFDLHKTLDMQPLTKTRCASKEHREHVFGVKPKRGILKAGYQIVTVRMNPAVVDSFSHQLLIQLNENEKYNQVVQLCGSAESAQVLLDNEGTMYFRPTCVGTCTSKSYGFKNLTRIPLRFQWVITQNDKKILSVEPNQGIVQPNEWMTQIWSFKPSEEKKYVLKPTLVAWGQGSSGTSSGGKKNQFFLRAVGEGSIGNIQTDGAYLDFGDIVVGSSATRHFTIFNNGSCSLQYKLLIDGTEEGEEIKTERSSIEIDKREGFLPARSKHFITATIRPCRRVTYQFAIRYQLVVPQSELIPSSVYEPQHLMYILASGVYPMLTITDIRPQGSAINLSKKSLWTLFSLDNLNAALDADPSNEEVHYNATAHQRAHNGQMPRGVMDFNFSAAPVGSDPFHVVMMFNNTGTVPCDWAFMFPKDIELELGYWVEDGERSNDELHEMKVMENKVFDVSPKRGTLQPGETIHVNFQYRHSMAGTDRLPVLLKIARGRELMLNFLGVTVDPSHPYIHLPSNRHTFNPVSVGETTSPVQMYELYNGGAIPVSYECDLTPLDIIKAENFDQQIFECLNPSGTIQPGRSAFIHWRFFPLEAKMYMVDIPLHIDNGDTAVVTFVGIGYDKRIMGDTMPFSDEPQLCGVPTVQKAEVPGQLGYLSIERLSFGNMPLFSQARRMLFVTNKSMDRSIFFEWHVTSQTDAKLLSIYPVRGEIAPGDYKMCRVSFMAYGVSAFYDLDLVCEISDLHEYTCYRKQLSAWEAERERQMNEFTVTERDLDADKRTPHVVDIVDGTPSGRISKLDALAEGRPISADGELSKYKTLPPIRQLTEDEKRDAERRRQKKLAALWQKPVPIKPSLLHLGITARTHDIQDFQTNFPNEYCTFYIDRTLSESQEFLAKRQFLPPSHLECSKAEANTVSSVLGSILRNLLDDAYFLQAVKNIQEEPIPYFTQYTELINLAQSDSKSSDSQMNDSYDYMGRQSMLNGPDSLRATLLSADMDYDLDKEENLQTESEKTGSLHEAFSIAMNVLARPMSESDHIYLLSSMAEMAQLKEKQDIKKLAEAGNVVEQVLENTILNLMYEALSSEYSIVSKPRFVAMLRKKVASASKAKF